MIFTVSSCTPSAALGSSDGRHYKENLFSVKTVEVLYLVILIRSQMLHAKRFVRVCILTGNFVWGKTTYASEAL